jgi:Photosynthesis system II assembly factor YCF48
VTELAKLVRRKLAGIPQPQQHPSADLLTAFSEDVLDDSERRGVLDHLSACSNCREIASLSLPLPGLRDATVLVPRVVRQSWLRGPVLRWGALAVCAIFVTSATLLLRRDLASHHAAAVVTSDQDVPAGKDAPKVAELSSTPAIAQPSLQGTRSAKKQSRRRSDSLPSQTVAENKPLSDNNAARTEIPQKLAPMPSSTSPVVAGRVQNPGEPVTLKAETAAASARALPASDAPNPSANSGAGGIQPLAATRSKAAKQTASGIRAEAFSSFAPVSVDAITPPQVNLVPRWTLTADGILQRSLDTGKSWQPVAIPQNTAKLLALAAIGSQIWVGGKDGTLFHSGDAGGHWSRVTPATEDADCSGDVIAIEFITALQGQVRTSTQQRWSTSDGGQTWQVSKQ